MQVYTYTQCGIDGKVNPTNPVEGWVEMMKCADRNPVCWEANVVPGHEIDLVQVDIDGNKYACILTPSLTPEAGKLYTITLNIPDNIYNENTYIVFNADDLRAVAGIVNGGKTGINITLASDIDLSGYNWTPISLNGSTRYTGTFDGRGHTITGLTEQYYTDDYTGLIGRLGKGGMVKDVVLEDVYTTNNKWVGGVVGWNEGTVSGCTVVSGSVMGRETTGGVVGNNVGIITGCSVLCTVTGRLVGGVVGMNNGTVTACYSTGAVTATDSPQYAGGVVGANNGTVTACYHATGTVSSNMYVGGVAGGSSNNTTLTACYWSGSPGTGIGDNMGSVSATEVDGTSVTWMEATDGMNAALESIGSEWEYNLDGGGLPVLRKRQ